MNIVECNNELLNKLLKETRLFIAVTSEVKKNNSEIVLICVNFTNMDGSIGNARYNVKMGSQLEISKETAPYNLDRKFKELIGRTIIVKSQYLKG